MQLKVIPIEGNNWNHASYKTDQKSIGKFPTLYLLYTSVSAAHKISKTKNNSKNAER